MAFLLSWIHSQQTLSREEYAVIPFAPNAWHVRNGSLQILALARARNIVPTNRANPNDNACMKAPGWRNPKTPSSEQPINCGGAKIILII
jgi:hypothetical protein